MSKCFILILETVLSQLSVDEIQTKFLYFIFSKHWHQFLSKVTTLQIVEL